MLEEDGVVSAAARETFTPTEVAKLYNFPSLNCKNQCIAIVEFGADTKPTIWCNTLIGSEFPSQN